MFKYEAIVFDFDGVLVESVDVKTNAFGELYSEYGCDISKKVMEYHLKNTGISRYIKFKYYHEQLLNIPYTEKLGETLSEKFSNLVLAKVIESPYVPGAHKFLDKFHTKIPLYIASGTPEEELRNIVRQRNMHNYFRGVYGTPANKGQIITGIINSNKYIPEKVLMIGDAIADFDGARDAKSSFLGRCRNGDNIFPKGVNIIQTLEELHTLL